MYYDPTITGHENLEWYKVYKLYKLTSHTELFSKLCNFTRVTTKLYKFVSDICEQKLKYYRYVWGRLCWRNNSSAVAWLQQTNRNTHKQTWLTSILGKRFNQKFGRAKKVGHLQWQVWCQRSGRRRGCVSTLVRNVLERGRRPRIEILPSLSN